MDFCTMHDANVTVIERNSYNGRLQPFLTFPGSPDVAFSLRAETHYGRRT
jgi:hypothetical protein